MSTQINAAVVNGEGESFSFETIELQDREPTNCSCASPRPGCAIRTSPW